MNDDWWWRTRDDGMCGSIIWSLSSHPFIMAAAYGTFSSTSANVACCPGTIWFRRLIDNHFRVFIATFTALSVTFLVLSLPKYTMVTDKVNVPTRTLSSGHPMPVIGLGTWKSKLVLLKTLSWRRWRSAIVILTVQPFIKTKKKSVRH